MEQNLNEELTVSRLWQDINFEGKQNYALSEHDELLLQVNGFSQNGYVISRLNAQTFDTTIATLKLKFEEIVRDIESLHQEWSQADDKLKLAGRVEKTKDYLLHAKAIGDIAPLLNSLVTKQEEITQLYQANYQKRLALVEQAEQLKDAADIKATNQAYKDLIEAWRAAPPIEKHKLDQLWQRIEQARNIFFERKRDHQEEYEKQMLANLDLKLELCEQAEALQDSEDWKETTENYKQFTESWKQIGRVMSHEKNEELWNRFITAQNKFFDRKRQHFEHINAEQEENLQQKLAIINRIEDIDIEHCSWKESSDLVNQLTEAWKVLGRVPKEQSDIVWNRFQEAKNRFYDAKRKHAEQHRLSLEDNLAKKQALINRIEKIKHSTHWRDTTVEINGLMAEWKAIGPIPRELSNELWETFIQARNYFFERKDADRVQKQDQFNQKIDNRIQQTKEFLDKLKFELEDDKQKVIEFRANVNRLSGDNAKDEELRNHMDNLANTIEAKIPNRERKIVEVEAQLQELMDKQAELKAQAQTKQDNV